MKTPARKHRLNTLFQKVGEVTVTWAYLENAVDLCIEAIHHRWNGEATNMEIPRTSFARKLTYFRDWYNSDEKYSELFPDFLSVVDMLEAASVHRHRLVHGIANNIGEYEQTGLAKWCRKIRKKAGTLHEEATYTVASIRDFRNHAVGLAIFTGAFAEILLGNTMGDDKPDNSLSTLFERVGGFFPSTNRRRNIADER